MSSSAVADLATLPTSDELVESIVLYHYGVALDKARAAVSKGDITLKGALKGCFLGTSSVFMKDAALSLVVDLISSPGYVYGRVTIFQRQALESKIREVLKSSPLASGLFELGLDVRVTTTGNEELRAEIYEAS